MHEIKLLITWLQILIGTGAAARGVYCCALWAVDQENGQTYRIRLRNLVIFAVLAECIGGLLKIISGYF